jgi:hypothetical protein
MKAGLVLEYATKWVADNHFGTLLSTVLSANKFLNEKTGYKIDFKEGYEHFGKKNKYRAQQVRHLVYKLMVPIFICITMLLTTLFVILLAIIRCICSRPPTPEKKK